jgi:hypothetical protein
MAFLDASSSVLTSIGQHWLRKSCLAALAPWIIHWDADASSDVLCRNPRRTRYRRNGGLLQVPLPVGILIVLSNAAATLERQGKPLRRIVARLGNYSATRFAKTRCVDSDPVSKDAVSIDITANRDRR